MPKTMSIMKIAHISIFVLSFLTSIATPIIAQAEMTAYDIIKKSDDLMRGLSIQGTYSMHIVTPKWERELTLQVYMQNTDKAFIRILTPAKEAGIGTLRIGSEMWNYLPNVERTIKIPPSMMLQSWMGSDFANDDLVKESSIADDYTHTIIAQTPETYTIELIPKENIPVIWGKLIRTIRHDDFVPLKEEYYNEQNKLIKVLEYSDIGQVSDRLIPKTWTMTPITKEGHQTVIKLVDVQYNTKIDEHIFSLSFLKKIQ